MGFEEEKIILSGRSTSVTSNIVNQYYLPDSRVIGD